MCVKFCLSLALKVRIGAMLAYTPLDEKSLALLLSYLQDFLKWVSASHFNEAHISSSVAEIN